MDPKTMPPIPSGTLTTAAGTTVSTPRPSIFPTSIIPSTPADVTSFMDPDPPESSRAPNTLHVLLIIISCIGLLGFGIGYFRLRQMRCLKKSASTSPSSPLVGSSHPELKPSEVMIVITTAEQLEQQEYNHRLELESSPGPPPPPYEAWPTTSTAASSSSPYTPPTTPSSHSLASNTTDPAQCPANRTIQDHNTVA